MKLGLGTVQFGMDYGVSNKNGRPSEKEIEEILKNASEFGIKTIDTSSQYGDSEIVLGRHLQAKHNFQIVLKGLTADIEGSFTRSLENLKQDRVYSYLIHDPENLSRHGSTKIFRKMQYLKERGLVEKIGVSVYDAAQIDLALELSPIDLVQLPISLLDQRLIKSGHLDKLKKLGVEIHARSIFLQGLLLMEPESLPPKFEAIRNHLKKLNQRSKDIGVSLLRLAVDFAISLPQLDRVIVGVSCARELNDIIGASETSATIVKEISEMSAWGGENILDPSRWSELCR